MNITLYTVSGEKKGTMALPPALFGVPVRHGLMHQILLLQQSNRRRPVAHVKTRGEVAGSTRKLYAQKHTGRARRGSIRSPLLRGGGKVFGPRKERNTRKLMPRGMRHAALCSCLSYQAKQGGILGLESYPDRIKTKDALVLLRKLPVDIGRRILFVVPERHEALALSMRNIPRTKTLLASYLNPEDVLSAHRIIFLKGAIEVAEQVFAKTQKITSSGSSGSAGSSS